MRHRNTVKILSRKTGPRKALLSQLADQLIVHESITTTQAKAKVLRPFVEKLITRGKGGTLADRRLLARTLTETTVKKLMDEIAPRYTTRMGGYVRIIKLGKRLGDAADVAKIELV